jgi:hypothetical protein
MSRYLTNLADVVRRSGLVVHEVDGWKTRGHGPMDDQLNGVVCHHTAGPKTGDRPSLNVVVNGRPGLAGPLSHLFLARSGGVHVVAAGLCWHAGGVRKIGWTNRHMIGIEAEATGVDPWPKVQMDAYARLCAELARGYSLKVDNVLGHKEVCDPPGRKIDPNFDMAAFRRDVAALDRPAAPKPAPKPQPVIGPHLLNRGDSGEQVKTVQRAVGVRVDGDFGPQTEAAVKGYQRRHGLAADGVVGPKTAARMSLAWRS